jgi:septum formation protein
MTRLVLASKSRARGALLRGAGLTFDAVDAGVDEDVIKARLLADDASPRHIAEVLAAAKAEAASEREAGLVIGADQTLDFEGALVDKAESLEEARDRLRALSGQPHKLHSAVSAATAGEIVWTHVETATLVMREVTDAWIDGYLARGGEKLLRAVGCYELEGEGVQLFDRIDGDYFTILGLPMLPLLSFLRDQGVVGS